MNEVIKMAAPWCRLRPLGTFSNMNRCLQSLAVKNLFVFSSRCNSNRTSIAKTNRKVYPRLYPTTIVKPDGSSYTIKYKEPRKILYLPFDVNKLTLEGKKARLAKYQVKRKQDIKDDLDDNFDARRYQQFWKSKGNR